MKKLLIATAAVALAAGFAGPSFAAAPATAKSPFCKYANAQRNPVAWNAYYHCLDMAAAPKKTVAARPSKQAQKDPYCAFASAQRNIVSWNARYNCLNR